MSKKRFEKVLNCDLYKKYQIDFKSKVWKLMVNIPSRTYAVFMFLSVLYCVARAKKNVWK